VDVLSVILLPEVRADRVAVLVRQRPTPFMLDDLEEALRWGHAYRGATETVAAVAAGGGAA
jgi:hypothetical protein